MKSPSRFSTPGRRTSCCLSRMMRSSMARDHWSISSQAIAGKNLQHCGRSTDLCGRIRERNFSLWAKNSHRMMSGIKNMVFSGTSLNMQNTREFKQPSQISMKITSVILRSGRKTYRLKVSSGLSEMTAQTTSSPLRDGQMQDIHLSASPTSLLCHKSSIRFACRPLEYGAKPLILMM